MVLSDDFGFGFDGTISDVTIKKKLQVKPIHPIFYMWKVKKHMNQNDALIENSQKIHGDGK
jgi:hypothetical protein